MSEAKWLATIVVLTVMIGSSSLAEEPRVQDIPLPKDATDATYVRRRGDIRFKVDSDMKTAGNFYTTALTEQKWAKAKKDNLQKNFWVQTFSKNNLTLEVRVDQQVDGCEVRLTPKGFLWDEDLAPRPKDLPIPEDANGVEYDDFFERIEFQSATALDDLAKFYVTKLDPQKWTKSGEDVITASTVQLQRTSGKATVTVVIRKEDDGNQVKISTKGMVWDEVKAANALAKKSMGKVADRDSKTGSKLKKPLELPKRSEKPLKGIAKLEKLPSRCVLTVDDQPIELANIVAYEAVSQGEWRIKIIATESAISQKALVELLKSTGTDDGWSLPSPYVRLELDDQDRIASIGLAAPKVAGNGSGKELAGEAIVEAGRARGTVKLGTKKFFDKRYSVEMSFDVPLLTRDSVPEKRLVNVAKLPNAGKLTIGGTVYSLAHVTAYETRQSDKTVTAVLLTERPINLAKLKASLSKPAQNDDDFNEFQPQIRVVFDEREQWHGLSFWADGLSVSASGSEHIKASAVIEDGRVRGSAKTTEPGDIFGKKYSFDITFDAAVLALPPAKSP